MTRFIPRDENTVSELNGRLSSTIFNNAETFVKYYNSGVINKNNDDTKDIVKGLLAAFKDVRERKGRLTFVSEAEILLDESVTELSKWTGVVRVRREIEDAVEENGALRDATFVIDSDGALAVESRDGETGELNYETVDADKVKTAEVDFISSAFRAEETVDDEGERLIRFPASAALDLDTHFISDVRGTIQDI